MLAGNCETMVERQEARLDGPETTAIEIGQSKLQLQLNGLILHRLVSGCSTPVPTLRT